jgi:site-specific DNA recombinase
LLQAELDRRLHAAQTTDPLKRREDALRRDQARLTKSMERLLTGYQEDLITLEELRCRMPELRKQQRANQAELQSLEMTAVDPTRNLRLVESLAEFRTRLRARGNVLEVAERQRVLRLLVQEILVGGDNITIRHSIPMPASSSDPNHGVRPSHQPSEPDTGPSYLLRSHGQHAGDNVSKFRGQAARLNLAFCDGASCLLVYRVVHFMYRMVHINVPRGSS